MKKTFNLFIIALSLMFAFSTRAFAVEWPQEDFNNDAFNSYFGQNVSCRISTSLVFSDPAEVKAINDGKILIVMSDVSDDSEFFPSTLGNSVIVCHDDDLISVYANLDGESVQENVDSKSSLKDL